MAEMLLVENPRKRGGRRKARTAAQKRATRKMVAANRRRRGGGRKRPVRARRRNPANTFGVPSYGYRRKNPARRRGGMLGNVVNDVVMPAAMGATGALALDIAWGYLPIPMNLKTGMFRHVVKAGGAIALGYLTSMVATKRTADQMTRGAMTVVIHGCMREMAQQFMPNVPLGDMGAYVGGMGYYSAGASAGVAGMGAYVGSEGAPSPYLAADTLNQPFAGPSAAQMARAAGEQSCVENENNMGAYY